ncbi:hypothetical protein P7K49_010361, partial [Saguinus oedipus]
EAPAGPALGLPSPEAESGVDRGEPEPMEVEEGELEIVPVRRSLKELIPVRAGVGGLGGGAVARAPAGEGSRALGPGAPVWRRWGAGNGVEDPPSAAPSEPRSARG